MRSVLAALCAVAGSLGIALLPASCQSGGIGDPCTPEDEYSTAFHGFDVAEESIESRSFQCQTRVCLVNHFQGRASCPFGQVAPDACDPTDAASCGEGKACVQASSIVTPCDPDVADEGASQCTSSGGACDKVTRSCVCSGSEGCPQGTICDPALKQCSRYVCHAPGSCQIDAATDAENKGKECCVPGTDTPIAVDVCGQCSPASKRSAEKAVYCSCRCGPPDGTPPDDDANYCDCPNGFECAEIRKDYKLGDPLLAGKYCVKQGTVFETEQECGEVSGYHNQAQCSGLGTGG